MIARYVRARLHRRIFVWFGATILLTGVIVALVMLLVGSPPGWKRDYEGMRALVGDRFERVYDDPVARRELADAISQHMDAVVVPLGPDQQPLDADGPRCGRPRHTVQIPVVRG